jgi:protein involved in polysaccharide export with SLBB domain
MRSPSCTSIVLLTALSVTVAFGNLSPRENRPIEPNDLLRITVVGLAQPNGPLALDRRVDAEGQISLPHLGTITVAEHTPEHLGEVVNRAYREQEILSDAQARAKLVEPADRATVKSGPINLGDVLLVRTWDLVGPQIELPLVLVVSEKGEIELPLVGSLVAKGQTEAALEARIVKLYHDKGIINKLPVCVLRTHAGRGPVATAPSR